MIDAPILDVSSLACLRLWYGAEKAALMHDLGTVEMCLTGLIAVVLPHGVKGLPSIPIGGYSCPMFEGPQTNQ